MSDPKAQMLAYIVAQSAPNKSEQNPLGYCYVPADGVALATELHNEELIQAMVTSRAADGSFPCRPTELGTKWAQAGTQRSAPVQQPQPQPQPIAQPSPAAQHTAQVAAVTVERDVPIPARKAFGRSGVGTMVDGYPFATIQSGESFFVAQDNPPKLDEEGAVVPKHRSFSNIVSQANKKLHPKQFVIREFKQNDGTVGARVWRLDDMIGERPTRARKAKPVAQPADQPGQWQQPAVAQPQPGFGAFPSQPAFGAGFPPPPPAAGQQGGFPPPPAGFPPPGLQPGPELGPLPSASWAQAPTTSLPPFDQ